MSESEQSIPASPSNQPDSREKPVEAPPPQVVTGSFDDPDVYQAFVRSLYRSIDHKLDTKIDSDSAREIANLNRLLTTMPPKAVEENREFFELAFTLLGSDQPNLVLVASVGRDLLEINDKNVGGLSRILSYVSGKTRLNAVLSGLSTVVVMSFAFMLVLGGGVKLLLFATSSGGTDVRLMQVLRGPAYNELLIMFHAAFLGSIVSIMVRIKSFLSNDTLTPLLTYVSIITRPIVAFMVSALVFCTIKTGVLSFQALDLSGPNGYYSAWIIGFLCGFSERLAQNFVTEASIKLGDSIPKPANQPSHSEDARES